METKICSKCKVELPLTIEYFGLAPENKDGFKYSCKKCMTIYQQQYKNKNKAKLKEYRTNNQKYISERTKAYRETRKTIISEYNKKYRENHLEYYAEHMKQWHKDNKIHAAKYKKEHLEENRISCNKYRAIKHELPYTLTTKQWETAKQCFNNKCAYCGKELPLTQDHFLALSNGGEYSINNIIPVCLSCNSSKHNSNFFLWYPKYKYYTKKREKMILKYLNYKNSIQQLKL